MSSKLIKLLDQLTKLHPKYIDLSLGRLNKLLNNLGNPQFKLPPTIHIAGTNGKGSTLSFISNILKQNNYLVHSYISPHLKSFEERITISNKQISKYKLYNLIKYVHKINSNKPITFFEITTAAAFLIFSQEKADFLVLETGLGGRLDATNAIDKSILDIITPISIDHKEFLGNTINKITNEKLGIIKSKSTIIFSKQKLQVKKHIKKRIKKINNKKLFFGENFFIESISRKSFELKFENKIFRYLNPKLNGNHQIENAATAICASLEIKKMGYKITNNLINKGLRKTTFPGRLEKKYLKNIPVFLDGAHNVAGAEQLYDFFKNHKKNRWLIIGMLNNKDLKNYLIKIKKIVKGVIAIKIPNEKNSYKTSEIANICAKINIKCIQKNNITQANIFLKEIVKPDEIIISGSLYLLGKVKNLYR